MKHYSVMAAMIAGLMTYITASAQNQFTFLHYSDQHLKTAEARSYAYKMLQADDNIRFALDGGDCGYTDYMKGWGNRNFYFVLGNHDVWEASKWDETLNAIPKFLKYTVQDEDVVWGSNGYYYKDFDHNGITIRLICMNGYEYKKTGGQKSDKSFMMLTGEQHEWLAEALKTTPSDGYVMIAIHSPLGNGIVSTAGQDHFTDKYFFEDDEVKFTGTKYDYTLIPRIVHAYLTRGKLCGTFNTGNPADKFYDGVTPLTFDLDLDFTTGNPAKFLFYLGGHFHKDLNSYLSLFPNQLQHAITTSCDSRIGDTNTEREYSEEGIGPNVAIDKITLDFDAQTINIKRIGRDSNNGEIVRGDITFDIKDPTTGITNPLMPAPCDKAKVFDLHGRKASAPVKGIYITNNKKTVIK